MRKNCFVFSHGWGLDREFWNNLALYFNQGDCVYFGEEGLFLTEDKNKDYIGIGHSLGFIKLISLGIRFKALIGLQSFVNFLGSYDRPKRSLELKAMKRNFERDSQKTLENFHIRCGLRPKKILNINKDLLKKEFDLLSRTFPVPKEIPILVIGTMDDPIVPPNLILDNFKKVGNVEISFISKGLHGLGVNSSGFIFKKIMGFLNEIEQK